MTINEHFKKCSKCKRVKSKTSFIKDLSKKDNLYSSCRACNNNKPYQIEIICCVCNVSFINKSKLGRVRKTCSKKCAEIRKKLLRKARLSTEEGRKKHNETSAKFRARNKSKITLASKKHRQKPEVKIKRNLRKRERFKTDKLYKLKENIKTLIGNSIRRKGFKKNSKTNKILGCTYEQLVDHLNINFYNFKVGDDNLDIDHIIPISSATNEEEVLKLNHYTNLQLLPKEYNRFIKQANTENYMTLENYINGYN